MSYKQTSPIDVISGGTGLTTTTTAYAPICAGTTATGALQVASTGLSSSGFVLTSNGDSAVPSFQAIPGTGFTFTQITDVDSPYTVLPSDQFIEVYPGTTPITVLLPDSPAAGRIIVIKDAQGTSATYNITVTTVGGSVFIDGSTSIVLNTAYQSVTVTMNAFNKYLVY